MKRLFALRIDKFYLDSFVLTISNMVTGIIAFIFSIVLSRELGAEGLGLYGLIMPVYNLLLCITSDGLITAISKISTLYFSRKEIKNLNKTMGSAFLFVAVWASCVAILVLACHRFIAVHMVKDARASGAIMILSPALAFVPLSAIIKGYFYGLGKYKVTATVDILEKLLRVVILLSTIRLLTHSGHTRESGTLDVGGTVAIAYFALATGELISLITLYTCYRIQKSRIPINNGKTKSRIQLIFDVLVISIPLCINGVLSSVISTVSALVLPRRLVAAGFTYGEALALIGRFSGMALNISTLPYIIVSSMLTVLVPELSLNMSRKNYWSAEERIAQVLKMACCVGISTMLVCLAIPETLGILFYRRSNLGSMISFAAPICLILFVSSPTFGILNALGRQSILLKNSLISSLLSLILIILLAGMPSLHIYGYGISIMITSIVSFILNLKEIRKICEIKIDLQDILILLLTGVASWLASEIAGNLLKTAPLLVYAAGMVITCFGSVLCFSSLAFRLKQEP